MSQKLRNRSIRAQKLLGRKVYDSQGKKVGRVYDLATEAGGESLRVRALLVGPSAWRRRFGWTMKQGGTEIGWERIDRLSPHIRLKAGSD